MIGWLAYILPALRVHSWGGFGSQLFAAHAILRIQKLFPYRRIKVIIHSSGVTKRTKEVDFSLIGINAFQKEDFEQLKLQVDLILLRINEHARGLLVSGSTA